MFQACDQAVGSIENNSQYQQNVATIYNAVKYAFPNLTEDDIDFRFIPRYGSKTAHPIRAHVCTNCEDADVYTDGQVFNNDHDKVILDFSYALVAKRDRRCCRGFGQIKKISIIFRALNDQYVSDSEDNLAINKVVNDFKREFLDNGTLALLA